MSDYKLYRTGVPTIKAVASVDHPGTAAIGFVERYEVQGFAALIGGAGHVQWRALDRDRNLIGEQIRRQSDAFDRVVKHNQPMTAHSIKVETQLMTGRPIVTGVVECAGIYISASRHMVDGQPTWGADFLMQPDTSMPVFSNGTGCGTHVVAAPYSTALEGAYQDVVATLPAH